MTPQRVKTILTWVLYDNQRTDATKETASFQIGDPFRLAFQPETGAFAVEQGTLRESGTAAMSIPFTAVFAATSGQSLVGGIRIGGTPDLEPLMVRITEAPNDYIEVAVVPTGGNSSLLRTVIPHKLADLRELVLVISPQS